MKILVTGSAGRIGRHVAAALRAQGHDLRTFDRRASREPDHWPGNVLDAADVRKAMQGCEAVVHLAAVPNDQHGREDELFNTNVVGNWNVLQAAAEVGARRVVFFSSVQVFGLSGTERQPDYLPLDDAHPHHPARPYSLSKNLGEETCRYFANTTGMSVISLRPTFVADADSYQWFRPREGRASRSSRWRRHASSDFWAYCDVEDVADAVVLSIAAEGVEFGAFLLAAKDTTSSTPTAELIEEFFSDVPLRLPAGAFDADPFRGLVDTSAAERVLGWRPQRSWREMDLPGE